jgi:DivIVA domain-containing protein
MEQGRLTAEQVHNVAFGKPPIGQRGYNEDQVDAFLDVVEAALREPAGRALTADQVRRVAFSKPPIGMRGYNKDEVDQFLEAVAAQLQPGSGAPSAARSHARDPAPESAGRRMVNMVAAAVRWIAD